MNQAELLMTGLKHIIQKQITENQNLENKNCSLEMDNKILADKNTELLNENKKLVKKFEF